MDTQTVSPEAPRATLIEKLRKLPLKLKLLAGAVAIILIALSAYFLLNKPIVNQTEQPQLPSSIIAKIGDSNVYQGYLDKELKFYPATKSAEVKEQLKQKVIDDQITLVEAKKEGLIQDFKDSPNVTDEEYLQRAKSLTDLKLKIEEGRDRILGSLVSLNFFRENTDPQILAAYKERAFSKISPVYEKLKAKEITLSQARQALSSDSAVKALDPAINANVAANFNNRKGNQITFWPEFDQMLWQTNVGDVTPLYIGRTQDKDGNIVEATYVFGLIDEKTEGAGYASYKQWLDQKKKNYNLSWLGQVTKLFALLPSWEVFAQDGDPGSYDGGYNDNGGNAGDGNLSNQNHTIDNPPNTCDNIPNSASSCDGGSSGPPPPPPPPPPLVPSWAGTVFTETGATLPGANVNITCSTGNGGAVSDATGAYSSPPIAGVNYTCNPINLSATYGGILCQEYPVNIPNTTAVQYNNFTCNLGPPACNKPCPGNGYCEGAEDGCNTCRPNASGVNVCQKPPACGETCIQDSNCAGSEQGCTVCIPADSGTGKMCGKPPACNVSCTRDEQCAGAGNGCTVCLPADSGEGKVCRKPAACGIDCAKDSQCAGGKDGCTVCLPNDSGTGNVCRPPAACGVNCALDSQCAGAKDGCDACRPADTGSGSVCRPTPACGVSCTKDSQCAGAKDGCSACVGGVCKFPPACGVACTTKADCTGARDGCSECLEGTCTNYNDNMCKCDGIEADLDYPNNFKMDALGKIEGDDTRKAQIADVTFRLTRDNQVVAKSNPITPQITESTPSKVRFKASWTTPPPAVVKGATYRVFADVRCKPKKIVASAAELADASLVSNNQSVDIEQPVKSLPPKGLEWAVKTLSKLFSNGKINPIVGEVLAQLGSPSPSPSIKAQSNLQLSTLNFVKLMDTDNCRFVMFKFDETLF